MQHSNKKIEEELNELKSTKFISFFKTKKGWIHLKTNKLPSNYDLSDFLNKIDPLNDIPEYEYSFSKLLFDYVRNNNKYNGIANFEEEENIVGYSFSLIYNSKKNMLASDKSILLSLIKEKNINTSIYQDFNSISNVIDELEDLILLNELNLNLEDLIDEKIEKIEDDQFSYKRILCSLN